MAERASIFQGVQIGVETTPGVPVAANKKLQSISIEPGIKADVKTFRPMGNKFATLAALGKELVEAKISGQPTYDELTYLFASLVSYALPSGSGMEKTWTFAPASNNPDTVKTYTVEQGSSVRAHKFSNGIITGLTLSFGREEISLDGTMIGAALQDGITMTASPTSIPLVPVLPMQVTVYLADTAAGLDSAAALARALSVEWSLTDRFGPLFVLNGSTGFVTTLEKEPKLVCKLKAEADSEGMGLLTQLRSGNSKFLRIKAIGPVIDTDPYQLTIDTACKVTNVSEFSDEDGIFAIEWELTGVHDADWNKAASITLVNTLASL
jgi:hypothetical protein